MNDTNSSVNVRTSTTITSYNKIVEELLIDSIKSGARNIRVYMNWNDGEISVKDDRVVIGISTSVYDKIPLKKGKIIVNKNGASYEKKISSDHQISDDVLNFSSTPGRFELKLNIDLDQPLDLLEEQLLIEIIMREYVKNNHIHCKLFINGIEQNINHQNFHSFSTTSCYGIASMKYNGIERIYIDKTLVEDDTTYDLIKKIYRSILPIEIYPSFSYILHFQGFPNIDKLKVIIPTILSIIVEKYKDK